MALEYPTGPLPDGFPVAEPNSLEVLSRIHHSDHGAWFPDSGPNSRFNLEAPWGTCYTAEVDLGAFMEKFVRVSNVISETALNKFRLSHFQTDPRLRIADFTDPLAKAAGVTAEIHSTTDYDMTQEWARAAHDAGFDGVRYYAASDPSCSLISVALFDDSNTTPLDPIHTDLIPEELIREAEERFGIVVVPAVLPRSVQAEEARKAAKTRRMRLRSELARKRRKK